MKRVKGRRIGVVHSRKYLILCEWCGEQKRSSREDTKTCSGKCRQRLAFFVRVCGYPPDHIPGPKTAQDAIDLEIMRLFREEARRREAMRKGLVVK